MKNQDDSTVKFAEVFQEELVYINERRKMLEAKRKDSAEQVANPEESQEDCGTSPFSWANEIDLGERKETPTLEDLRKEALKSDLCGLAISGGGVRAATFGLGVLQGLAKEKLLSRFDYLSTVSGGGYIGGFLSAWIRKDGIEEVEKSLASGAKESKKCRKDDQQIRPIHHLRKYSNHLAPVPSVFSYDGWSLLTVFLRNLLLNQLTIIIFGLFVFAFLRSMVELINISRTIFIGQEKAPYVFLSTLFALILLCGIQLFWVYRVLGPNRKEPKVDRKESKKWMERFGKLVSNSTHGLTLLLLFKCVAIAQCLTIYRFPEFDEIVVLLQTLFFFGCSFFATQKIDPRRKDISYWLARFFFNLRRLIPGLISGFLLVLFVSGCHQTWQIAAFGVPLAILSNLLGVWLMVGWLGNNFNEADREWWGTISSRMLIAGVFWATLFGFVIFSPVLVWWVYHWLEKANWSFTGMITTVSAVLGTVGTLTTGIYAARSLSVGKPQNKLMRLTAEIAPYLFAVIVFFGICILWTFCIYDGYAIFHKDHNGFRSFAKTVASAKPKFLEDLSAIHYIPMKELPSLVPGIEKILPENLLKKDVYAICPLMIISLFLFFLAKRISSQVGINRFSLQSMYSMRLGRCYLGASRIRSPSGLTNFDGRDDFRLSHLLESENRRKEGKDFRDVPFHIFNCAVNLRPKTEDQLAIQDRRADSFALTPFHCGSDVTKYVKTEDFGEEVTAGLAMGVSGAAVSPSMGYRTSPGMALLLAFFNLRLGWWFPKPGASRKLNSDESLSLLLKEMVGAGIQDEMVNVSDGGHFENMGVYELIRRGCRFIVCVDADSRPDVHENIGRVVRMARIDFNAFIDIDADDLTPVDGMCNAHFVVGKIHYNNGKRSNQKSFSVEENQGVIVWISLAMTGDEPEDLQQYQVQTNQFPYAPTFPDQFFSEDQFESYRELGVHSVEDLFSGIRFKEVQRRTESAGTPVDAREANSRKTKMIWGIKQKIFSMGPPEKFEQSNSPSIPEIAGEVTYQPINDLPECDLSIQLDIRQKVNNRELFELLHHRWLPLPKRILDNYVQQNHDYMAILTELRSKPELSRISNLLYGSGSDPEKQNAFSEEDYQLAESLMTAQMMTHLQNVWFALDMETYMDHPVNEGWKKIFENWTTCHIIQKHWRSHIHKEFSPVFRGFIESIQIEMERKLEECQETKWRDG